MLGLGRLDLTTQLDATLEVAGMAFIFLERESKTCPDSQLLALYILLSAARSQEQKLYSKPQKIPQSLQMLLHGTDVQGIFLSALFNLRN